MKVYAVTAKKTRNPITKQHYLDLLDYYKDLGIVANVAFETTRGLHVHFMLKTSSTLDYTKLKPTKYGWNVKAIPIYDYNGWIKYCRKDFDKNYNQHNNILDDFNDEMINDDQMVNNVICNLNKPLWCCNNSPN